jgi:hypothetical protein
MVQKGVGAEVVGVVDFFGDGGASDSTGGVFRRGTHAYGFALFGSGATEIILGQDWFGGRVCLGFRFLVLYRYLFMAKLQYCSFNLFFF